MAEGIERTPVAKVCLIKNMDAMTHPTVRNSICPSPWTPNTSASGRGCASWSLVGATVPTSTSVLSWDEEMCGFSFLVLMVKEPIQSVGKQQI